MTHIGKTYDGYTVISSSHSRYHSNTIYTLSNGTETITIYYSTFRRLIAGQTTISKIKQWRELRNPKPIQYEPKLTGHLNRYGYHINKKTHQIEPNPNEYEILIYIQFAYHKLNKPINKIMRELNKNGIKYKKKGKWTAKRIQGLL